MPAAAPTVLVVDDEAAFGQLVAEHLAASGFHVLQAADGRAALTQIATHKPDALLIDLATKVDPAIEVIFIDTGYHFPETLEFVDALEHDWGLNVTRTQPGPSAPSWPCGSERCCEMRKVEPLSRAVAGRAAWLTSVKRVDAPTRANMKIVHFDDKFGLVKVNPMATWTDDDVAYYLDSKKLPTHPLWAQGYASIGCAPVTVKPLVAGDRRSGRWAGADKEECGLHEA